MASYESDHHDVEVYRELDDGTELTIKCVVTTTLYGSRWNGWRWAGIEYDLEGELDGKTVALDEGEQTQLHDSAADIESKVKGDLEEAELSRYGGDY